MKQAVVFLCLMVQGCYSGTIKREIGDKCTTPNSEAGECRNINNCPVLLQYVKESVAPTSYLRESSCGFEGLDPLVCCPELSSRIPPWVTSYTSQDRNRTRVPVATKLRPNNSGQSSSATNQCGTSRLQVDRIVGGDSAPLGSWPWIAALGYRSRTKSGIQWLCGGALVTRQHVITAAHCVVIPSDKTLAVVRLGDLDLEEGVNDGASPVDIQVERAIPHPDYKSNAKVNDIAIVKLGSAVQLSDNIQLICLPSAAQQRTSSLVGKRPFVAGWGALFFRGPSTTALQQVDVGITDENTCKNAYQNQQSAVIDHRVICAGGRGKDACQGDSGGPLMLDEGAIFYLIGVVSYGKNCAEPGYAGVYTKVSAFMDWISQNMY